ncbi:hypothetical protein RV10_GL002369 [Enterococcus pallens]|nr:hypothetical protein RV10_GL002369 [Enterococcus pallens]
MLSGGALGVFIMALCISAKNADIAAEKAFLVHKESVNTDK